MLKVGRVLVEESRLRDSDIACRVDAAHDGEGERKDAASAVVKRARAEVAVGSDMGREADP
jgi:hypothetical protein